jgi:hypothetical protein
LKRKTDNAISHIEWILSYESIFLFVKWNLLCSTKKNSYIEPEFSNRLWEWRVVPHALHSHSIKHEEIIWQVSSDFLEEENVWMNEKHWCLFLR